MKTFGYDGVCNKDFSFFRETNLVPDNTILLPFQISLKDGFLENSNTILSKIKSEKIAFNPSPFSTYDFADFDPTEDHILTIVELNQNKYQNKESLNPVKRDINIPESITVRELANRMAEQSSNVIKFLFGMGVTVTINQSLAADTAEYLVKEFGHNPIREQKAEEIIKKIIIIYFLKLICFFSFYSTYSSIYHQLF